MLGSVETGEFELLGVFEEIGGGVRLCRVVLVLLLFDPDEIVSEASLVSSTPCTA